MLLCSTLMLLWGAPQAMGEQIWQIAPGPSSVDFKIRHLLYTAEGSFGRFEGRVETAGSEFEGAHIEAAIELDSVHTGHEDRDRELLGPTFFWVERHPVMRFESTRVTERDDGTYDILGKLTLRGITKPIELEATFDGRRTITGGRERADFVATGALNRFDYDLKWNERLDTGQVLLSETVEIHLDIALIRRP